MWWEVIKNQELETSQLGATMDWENEVIPDKKDDECRKIIMGMIDRAKRYEDLSHDFIEVDINTMGAISEESICKALKQFKNLKDQMKEDVIIGGWGGFVLKNHIFQDFGSEHEAVENYQNKIYSTGIQILEGGPTKSEPNIIDLRVRLTTKVRKDKKLLEDEYQKVCEYIFEEYYNTDFKIE